MSEPNHYATLQVSPLAGARDIEAAYRRLARQFHPDVSDSPDAARRMAAINAAYAVLREPELRAAYDARRRQLVEPAGSAPGRTAAERAAVSLLPPVLTWEPILELPELRSGTSAAGYVRLRNTGGGHLTGTLRCSSPHVRVTPSSFSGNDVMVRMEVTLGPDERPRRSDGMLAWLVRIDSNGGEGAVTVRAPYRADSPPQSGLARWLFPLEALGVAVLAAVLLLWPLWVVLNRPA